MALGEAVWAMKRTTTQDASRCLSGLGVGRSLSVADQLHVCGAGNLGLRRISDLLCVDQEVKEPAQTRNEFPNLGEAILTGQNLVRLLSQ